MPIASRFAAAAARAYGLFRAAAGGAAAAVDPFFNYVTALLHGDGTNGAQNNTFLDSSTNNFTITRNGNTTQGTFSPFSQTGWSNYFDGTTDYLTAPSNAAFGMGTGDFTLEAWVYFTAAQAEKHIIDNGTSGGIFLKTQATTVGIGRAMIAEDTMFSYSFAQNTWYHIAFTRSGTTVYGFVNGAQIGSATNTNNYATGACYVGAASDTTKCINGYISNLRIVKGTAVYTAAFTPSTTPLTAISGTSLLTCQANRFLDASSNAFTITKNGDVSVQPFSPFNPTSAWSASSNGGSGYFDGSGDYLTAPAQTALSFAGDFTIETWVYFSTAPSGNYGLFDARASASTLAAWCWDLFNSSGTKLDFIYGAARVTSASTVPTNQWVHLAVTRSGSTIRQFINGVLDANTATTSAAINANRAAIYIGNLLDASTALPGYMADTRVVNGTAIYTATFTPPTAPLTAVTNTQLLLSYTNGGIYDNAAVADYETVGNAQISTSVKKYGTGSIAFDGTGDWLILDPPTSSSVLLGTGDFTIEMWINLSTVSPTYQGVYDGRTADPSVTPHITLVSGAPAWWVSASARITGPVLSTGTWYHLAVCRVASQTKMFVNGTQVGSTYADTNNYLTRNSPTIGVNFDLLYPFTGYIDDFRFTKGVGRYQYNFTPPTAAFPNIGGTVTLTADPYYRYTTLLLPGNGTNGAQNNTFLDSSSNAFTITRNGNTTQGTFTPFSQTGWGNYFGGNAYLVGAASTATQFSADFTIEAWVYPTTVGLQCVLDTRSTDASAAGTFFGLYTSNQLMIYTNATVVSGGTVPANAWSHVALVRSGATWTLYLNGTSVATYSSSANLSNGNNQIGASTTVTSSSANYFNGYISNLRVVKGTAVYTANFTPPTTPLTAITNTSYLTCQSNRFIDNSSNAIAITPTNASVQAFSPFAPTASYSASTVGGSGYFDGSGDYLTLPSGSGFAFGTGDFTVEAWVNTSTTGGKYIIDARNSGQTGAWAFGFDLNNTGTNNSLGWWNGSALTQPGTEAVKNAWNHCVYVRSGTTYAMFLNGTRIGTGTDSTNYSISPTTSYIGCYWGLSAYMTGYMADIRTVKGTAVYSVSSSTLTVPTAPLTAVSGTSLLLSATNGAITDATAKNDLETVGNAQISTTQSKFGGSSMYFDGTGDILSSAASQNYVFTGDFTVEGWVYIDSTMASSRPDNLKTFIFVGWNTGNTPQLFVYGDTSTAGLGLGYYDGTTTSQIAAPVAKDQWVHIAFVRYGAAVYGFVNGVRYTISSSLTATIGSTNTLVVAGNPNQVSAYYSYLKGYIDDLRITKGIARYTSNFTPPTSAFLTL